VRDHLTKCIVFIGIRKEKLTDYPVFNNIYNSFKNICKDNQTHKSAIHIFNQLQERFNLVQSKTANDIESIHEELTSIIGARGIVFDSTNQPILLL
jgi:hypothetical protein